MINYFIAKTEPRLDEASKFFFFETIRETGGFLRCKSTEFGEQVFPLDKIAMDNTLCCDVKGVGIKIEIVEIGADLGTEKSSEVVRENSSSTETAVAKAHLELREKAKVKRGGWVPDFNDTNQLKYWPEFDMRSGFAYTDTGYAYSDSYTVVGSRLCFPTEEMAKEFALENIELYRIVYCTE